LKHSKNIAFLSFRLLSSIGSGMR